MTALRTFTGTITGVDTLVVESDRAVFVTDTDIVGAHASPAFRVEVGQLRPTPDDVATAAKLIADAEADTVVAVGSGAALDTAKLAAAIAGLTGPQVVLVPSGREPWRAYTPFGVVLHGPGEQETTGNPAYATADVRVVADQLVTVPAQVLALAAVDAFVQSVESLISTQSHPYARGMALGAALIAARGLAGVTNAAADQVDAAADVVVAPALALDAFMATRLGVAHALATHLAARTCDPHDQINAIVGRSVIGEWSDHPALVPLTAGLVPFFGSDDLPTMFDAMLAAAAIPAGLSAAGLPWDEVEAILPLAATSSGIQTLPRPFDDDALSDFARTAWAG